MKQKANLDVANSSENHHLVEAGSLAMMFDKKELLNPIHHSEEYGSDDIKSWESCAEHQYREKGRKNVGIN